MEKISVLSYNTHLCGVSGMEFFGTGGKIFGKGRGAAQPMAYLDRQRADLICNRIKDLNPDIVALQEVWDLSLLKSIHDGLKDLYSHCFAPKGVNTTKLLKQIPTILRRLIGTNRLRKIVKPFSVGCGLMLLSKFPLEECTFSSFPTGTLAGDDQWALKGVIACTVATPEGGVRVGITHAGTNCGGPELPHIQLLIDKTMCANGRPSIMMGDLNVHWDSDNYILMNDRLFKAAGASEARGKETERRCWLKECKSLLEEYQQDLLNLKSEYEPNSESVGGGEIISIKPFLIFKKIVLARGGRAFWRFKPIPPDVDLERVNEFRIRLRKLTARCGIAANDPMNLLFAYFMRKSSIAYLAQGMGAAPTRLDYIYFANPASGVEEKATGPRLDLASFDVLRDWVEGSLWEVKGSDLRGAKVVDDGAEFIRRATMGQTEEPERVDLSDHYPLLATFEVTRSRA